MQQHDTTVNCFDINCKGTRCICWNNFNDEKYKKRYTDLQTVQRFLFM